MIVKLLLSSFLYSPQGQTNDRELLYAHTPTPSTQKLAYDSRQSHLRSGGITHSHAARKSGDSGSKRVKTMRAGFGETKNILAAVGPKKLPLLTLVSDSTVAIASK